MINRLFFFLYLFSLSLFAAPPEALFSPYEGEKAFNRIYQNIKEAKSEVLLSIYSWSDAGITNAMESLLEKNPSVKLRVILHRPLAKKSSTLSKVAKLEKLGAMFKMAKMNMHEKFVLVDKEKLVNSSANMSGGAKYRYSEDFVFIDSDGEADNQEIIESFAREFSILWNSGEDIVTKDEVQKADVLPFNLKEENVASLDQQMTLHASSMNFKLSKYAPNSSEFEQGKVLKLTKKKNSDGELLYTVSSALIRAIDNAKESVYLSLNHFNLYSVSEALIRAVQRGVEIKLAVDNQEFKTLIRDEGRTTIEMTPRFVRDWKKLPGNENKEAPVRIKFYSYAPHFSSWLLNHHKYVLIDVNTTTPILFAGSFNLSNNAEFNQFDSLVEYQGEFYLGLINNYKDNHQSLWMLNRSADDKPLTETLGYFKRVYEDSYIRLHAEQPENALSLSWDEALKLNTDISRIAPGIFNGLFRNKGCSFYNFKTKKFFGGSCR